MEFDDSILHDLCDHVNAITQSSSSRRTTCSSCTRPMNVCLCSVLPKQPIATSSRIIIVHHPHEHQHNKLSTVPILAKSLQNATTIVSRRLRSGVSPFLDTLRSQPIISDTNQTPRAIYLFPPTHSHPSIELSNLYSLYPDINKDENLPLIVFDGTWNHAKEMVNASSNFLSKFAIRVCLDCDESVNGGSIYDSELILRKEPFGGCVSTMEAVARVLRVLEPNGLEIERSLIGVLREMVLFQKSYLKPMKPRPKLLKKGKREEDESLKVSGTNYDHQA